MEQLRVGDESYGFHRLDERAARLPYTLRILLENVLRQGSEEGAEAVAGWVADAEPSQEIAFAPARVLLQDFTGVPCVVDLAAMRDAMRDQGGDPKAINPLIPVELVIDHSVQVDEFATRLAIERNVELEFERNHERYAFLRWGQGAFDNFRVVPPNTGIVHQVNLEYLARVVEVRDGVAFPDTLVGTDSHTTMVNGLGVLGWGVGGIEAEAAMLGEALSMLVPQVVGFRLTGRAARRRDGDRSRAHRDRDPAQDRSRGEARRVLRAGRRLARPRRPRDAREHEPRDRRDVRLLPRRRRRRSGTCASPAATPVGSRSSRRTARRTSSGMTRASSPSTRRSSSSTSTTSSRRSPGRAGRRTGCRSRTRRARSSTRSTRSASSTRTGRTTRRSPTRSRRATRRPATAWATARSAAPAHTATLEKKRVAVEGSDYALEHGSVVIAAITSCTNTSNPSVMIAAGLLAQKAVERGLQRRPWVKSSLAPGSKVVTDYYRAAGLDTYLDELGFNTVGYGCTTCIGNSGPLPEPISAAVADGDLVVCAVLSGNRNFEARIHGEVKANYLASPPLVVAYALAGRMDVDLVNEPLGQGSDGEDVFLRDLWPSRDEIDQVIGKSVKGEMFSSTYADVFTGDERWRGLETPEGELYEWDDASTYVRLPPYFDGMTREPEPVADVEGARCLVMLGDSVTTDHISPAGAIRPDSPAGQYLTGHGVERRAFNSYGSRRGNHEVMVRGTFANVRLKNLLVPGSEGTWTAHLPDGEVGTIYEVAERYRAEGVPTIVIAGKEYGSGSSRDWAAKGPNLLGVRAAIADSYERIHRSNLLMMGIAPLQFMPGENAESLGLTGREEFSITGLAGGDADEVTVRADDKEFRARLRLDTPREREYFRHGGILQYVLRRLLSES